MSALLFGAYLTILLVCIYYIHSSSIEFQVLRHAAYVALFYYCTKYACTFVTSVALLIHDGNHKEVASCVLPSYFLVRLGLLLYT